MLELYEYQEKCLDLLSNDNGFALLLEQGLGKTIIMLMHLSNLFMAGKIKNALIVAPLSTLGSWEQDMKKLPPHRRSWCEKGITLINYDKISRKTSSYREELCRHWGCIVLDESHSIKSRTSNRTKYLMSLSQSADYRYILTGTAIGNKRLEDFYTQMNFIQPGTFPSWKEFAAHYLIERRLPGMYVDIIVGYRNQDELLSKVAKHSIRLLKKDCLDLPDKLPDEVIYCTLKESKMYKEALDMFISEFDITMANPLVKLSKIRQLLSGNVKDENGEVHKVKCDKLSTCMELIESINGKTVIFCEFTASIDDIAGELDKQKIKYVVLDGRTKDKKVWQKFQEDKEIQVILIQYLSGNAGINLYESSHTIYYEPNLSTTVISQSKDRTHRIGVKNPCNYYWLITKDTIEDDIYRKLQKAEDFNKYAMNEIIKLGGLK